MNKMIKKGTFDLDRLYFLLGFKPVLRVELDKYKTTTLALSGLKNFKICRYRQFVFVSKDAKKTRFAKKLTELQECRFLKEREIKKRRISEEFNCHLKPAELKLTEIRIKDKCKIYGLRVLPPENEHIVIETLLGGLYGYPKCCARTFAEKNSNDRSYEKYVVKELDKEKIAFKFRGNHLQLIHIHCSRRCGPSKKLIFSIKSRLNEFDIDNNFLDHLCHQKNEN